ncbi:MAG: class I SAM-dependent methyltransferase [Thermoflexales bacterium]|nr:class I SAM-dependent methyltransferase [Thermoflexales bacterium]
MREIEANKQAWGLLSQDHYETFRKCLRENHSTLSPIIQAELGDIAGKTLIHLQCNTGADTISLARMGAVVTGVDLVPDNIRYARLLADEFGVTDATFITADIMEFMEIHDQKYDIVFTSEGAIGWLPDLKKWGKTIRHLLKEDGFFYVLDSHPVYLMFDEERLKKNELVIKYPYFVKRPERFDTIGGYASEKKDAENFDWMYTVGEIINVLTSAGLGIEYLNEYDTLFWNAGGMEWTESGQYRYASFRGQMPFSFSLKATVRR